MLFYDLLTLAADVTNTDNHYQYSFGSQYKLSDILMLRAGYNQGLTCGVGLILSDFQLDYALQLKDFVSLNKIGFIYSFGSSDEKDRDE